MFLFYPGLYGWVESLTTRIPKPTVPSHLQENNINLQRARILRLIVVKGFLHPNDGVIYCS